MNFCVVTTFDCSFEEFKAGVTTLALPALVAWKARDNREIVRAGILETALS